MRRRAAAAGAVLALAVGSGAAGAVGAMALNGGATVFAGPTAVEGTAAKSGMSNTAQVAAAVQPSVVSITVTSSAGEDTGSGVIIRSDGAILTNAHVVGNAQSAAGQGAFGGQSGTAAGQISVRFSDGRTATAKVLGTDTSHDIAVIKAGGVSGLKPATLGNSSALAVGDSVLAVGSPLGLDGSVTSGIVSALNRTIQESNDKQSSPYGQGGGQASAASIKNAIQTDAAINPGNSGGALVNGAGQVVGVNTAIATTGSGSGSIGVGFAIPMNTAKQVADQIISRSAGAATGA